MPNYSSKLYEFIICGIKLGVDPGDKWKIIWKETKNLRARFGLEKHHPSEIYSLNTIYGKLYFRDNFGDITNLPNIFHRQVYGVKKLKGDGVVLDIGANIGLVAALIAFYNPGVPIHCFEPLSDNVKMIRMNCPSARTNQVALGAERGYISLEVDQNHVMASSITRERMTHSEIFEVLTLDEYVNEHDITAIEFIKLDAEGMELEILNGALKTLENTFRIVIETHGFDQHQAVLNKLKTTGYFIERAHFNDSTGMIHAVNHELIS